MEVNKQFSYDFSFNNEPPIFTMFSAKMLSFSEDAESLLQELYAQENGEGNDLHSLPKEEAASFINTQLSRIDLVEKSLLGSIQNVVSVNSKLMTASELVQLCQRLDFMNEVVVDDVQCVVRQPQKTPSSQLDKTTDYNNRKISQCTIPRIISTNTQNATLIDETNLHGNTRLKSSEIDLVASSRELKSFSNIEMRPSVDSFQNIFAQFIENNSAKICHDKKRENELEKKKQISNILSKGGVINDSYEYVENKNLTINTITSDEEGSLDCTVKGEGFFKIQDLKKQMTSKDSIRSAPEKRSNKRKEVPVDEVLLQSESFLSDRSFFDNSVISLRQDSSPENKHTNRRGDESLLVTPTLARYQLEPDDSSIGVKVVPKRHSNAHDRIKALEKNGVANEETEEVTFGIFSGGFTKENILPRIEEVLSPNVSTRFSRKVKQFEENIEEQSYTRNRLGPLLSQSNQQNETCEARKYRFARYKCTSNSLNAQEEKNLLHYNRNATRLEQGRNEISLITLDEYNSAPRVVQMQASFEEVNAAVAALNLWISKRNESSNDTARLEDDLLSCILQTTRGKCERLMMSLCHWRRLDMQINGRNSDFYFILK